MKRALAFALLAFSSLCAPERAAAFATFEIIVADDPNEGFNDPTPVEPIGGNPGTTLGEQRLNALRYATDAWGARIDSAVVIKIEATFDPIECIGGYATTLALGGTTYLEFVEDDQGEEVIVPTALADRIEGRDLEPGEADISIQFNSNLDDRMCLDGIAWYYGFDGEPGIDTDIIDTALHEIAHGLGIQSLHDAETGELSDGVALADRKHVLDLDTEKHWGEMTTPERLASQGNARRVVWNGQRTSAQSRLLLETGMPHLESAQVPGLSGLYADASFGTWSVATTVSGELATDPTNECEPAGASGKVVLLSWECSHSSWVISNEHAGAIAVLIESSADWDVPAVPYDEDMPFPVGVPVIAVSTPDFNLLRDAAQSGAVSVALSIDEDELLGGDEEGRVMMNITSPTNSSSIAHLEPVARPNLLMEPFTTPRTLHELDLTPAMLQDIGWEPFCGNGEIDQEEECDDGADNSDTEPNACRVACKAAACGDGVKDEGEACDGGEANSSSAPNACRMTCERPACGDGVKDDGEACDDGADNGDHLPDACRTSCALPRCGDGVADRGEACDDGEDNSDTAPDACRTSCEAARCGDGVADLGEACDDGEANSDTAPDACRTSCEAARCGDGVVDQGELCDPESGMPCNTDCSSEDPDVAPRGDGGMSDHAASADGEAEDSGCGCRAINASSSTSRHVASWLSAAALCVLRIRRSRRASARAQ